MVSWLLRVCVEASHIHYECIMKIGATLLLLFSTPKEFEENDTEALVFKIYMQITFMFAHLKMTISVNRNKAYYIDYSLLIKGDNLQLLSSDYTRFKCSFRTSFLNFSVQKV